MSKRARNQRDKRAEAEAVHQAGMDAEEEHEYDFWRDDEEQHSPQHSGLSFYGN